MLTKLVFISLLSKCWPFDPDIDFCDDPSFSGGVITQNVDSFLFKGEYYWRTRPLATHSGIIGYGRLISSEWPDLKGNITLVFTVLKGNELVTVFVVNNRWFGYQNKSLTIDGSVGYWPDFNKLKVTTAFTFNFGGPLVYVLHSNNNNYVLYNFTNIPRPKIVRSGETSVRDNYLVFTEIDGESIPGTTRLGSLINARAALTYPETLILLSKSNFCAINLTLNSFETECIPHDISKLLDCPIDTSNRPTTITITTVKITSISETTSVSKTTSISKTSSERVSTKETYPSGWPTVDSDIDPNVSIKTGITIVGSTLETKINNGTTPLESFNESKRKNSKIWIMAIILALIIMSIIAILIVAVISRAQYKKRGPKGKVIYIR